GRREVGGRQQAGPLPDQWLQTLVDELLADIGGPGVLPDDRVGERLAGRSLPDQRGLALIGHADRGQLVGAETSLAQSGRNHLLGRLPDLHRVMFDPAWRWIDLAMLAVGRAQGPAVTAEDNESGPGRPLVDGGGVASADRGHGSAAQIRRPVPAQ